MRQISIQGDGYYGNMVQQTEQTCADHPASHPHRQLGRRDPRQMVGFPQDQEHSDPHLCDPRHLLRPCDRLGGRYLVPALQAHDLRKGITNHFNSK